MPRLPDVRRRAWRAALLLILALGSSAPGPARALTSVNAAPVKLDQPGQQPQQGPPASTAAAQERPRGDETQNPDERAAGGERLGNDDEATAKGTLLLTPSRLRTTAGSRIRLTLSILGADDVRRLPVTLRFDPAVVAVAAVRLGRGWRNDQQPVLLHDASRPGELVIGAAQIARDQPGINGSAELLEIELIALAPGNAGLSLERFAAIGNGSRVHELVALEADILVR